MRIFLFFLLFICSIKLSAQKIVSSIKTKAGQTWMTRNLDVSKFNNGDTIQKAQTKEDWEKAGENKQPIWCYYNFDIQNGEKYGKLYNWFAVVDPRGLAPKGWHIPKKSELEKLINPSLISHNNANNSKVVLPSNTQSTNETIINIFKDYLAGGCNAEANFSNIGDIGIFWSSSIHKDYPVGESYILIVESNNKIYIGDQDFEKGFSVRCVKD